ncbi:relaxase/mobilization nuclease domain-containing protein [Nonlabens sp. Asnod3-A02]|uniref:relaxase/mobilization nuclease domain-containing protein n=1 Tax=Nonlabens sp. Asnod3-A02 TaxID=3160579 RepID=UPI00386AE0EF
MIAKLASISYCKNALVYCEKGGELLTTNKSLGNAKQIYDQMQLNNSSNDKCINHTFHVKIRIAPEDKGKLNSQDWIDISSSYAKKIGFNNNPFAVYIHKEATEDEHIHIVSSRIKSNNTSVSDSFTHYKNMDWCREIERKYKLRQVARVLEAYKANELFKSNDSRNQVLLEKVKSAIGQSDNLQDLEFHLKNLKVKVKIGRGISFKYDGVVTKGSKLGREFSLSGIKKQLSYKGQALLSKQPQNKIGYKIKF